MNSETPTKLKNGELVELTAEEILARTQEEEAWLAEQQGKAQLQGAYDAASAVFESLEGWKKSFWKNVREDVGNLILAGDIAGAVQILTDIPAFYPDAETDRAAFLALFP